MFPKMVLLFTVVTVFPLVVAFVAADYGRRCRPITLDVLRVEDRVKVVSGPFVTGAPREGTVVAIDDECFYMSHPVTVQFDDLDYLVNVDLTEIDWA